MGSHCTQLQKEEEMRSEQHPIYTAKLGLPAKLEHQMKPCQINDSVLEITTERNMQESGPQQLKQNDQCSQLLSRRYYDDTQTINRTNKLVYSQNIEVLRESENINVLNDLGVSEVQSQKQKEKKEKRVDEEDDVEDYDAMCKQNWDQVAFKSPEAMNLIDKQQALQSSIQLKNRQR